MATRAERVLVTFDRNDYTLLHRAWQAWSREWGVRPAPCHAGIALITSARDVGAPEIARALEDLGGIVEDATNRLFVWDRRIGWIEIN